MSILTRFYPARQAADRTKNSRFRFKNTTKTRRFTVNYPPIVNLGETARSVARERWRQIPPDPPDRMPADKIDRVLAIGYLCGFESDWQSWGEYLKVWEVEA